MPRTKRRHGQEKQAGQGGGHPTAQADVCHSGPKAGETAAGVARHGDEGVQGNDAVIFFGDSGGLHSGRAPTEKIWILVQRPGRESQQTLGPGDVLGEKPGRRHPTPPLCTGAPLFDATWENIRADILLGKCDGIWISTPCETFSHLREKPPGQECSELWNTSRDCPRAR